TGRARAVAALQAGTELDRSLADANVGALVATRERLLCAVIDARDDMDPIALAARARESIAEDGGPLPGARAETDTEGRRLAPGRRVPPRPGGRAPTHVPRGALRARGRGARQRVVAAGGLPPRPVGVPAPAVASGR